MSDLLSELRFTGGFPSVSTRDRASSLLIYDQRLELAVPGFRAWARRFPRRLPVRAGEELKSLAKLPARLERILGLTADVARADLQIIAVGGGSVGDFAGFVASVLRRGVRLVHVPSTWLAAIDSAHGGKTALNARGAKNQIGTFYAAETVWISRRLLKAQGEDRAAEAMGELVKMALLSEKRWATALLNERGTPARSRLLWRYLPEAIAAKRRVIAQDPFEESGRREILNLGHTAGHVFEAAHALPHGVAVAAGLRLALEWSWAEDLLKARDFARLSESLERLLPPLPRLKPLRAREFRALLLRDKKVSAKGRLRFVFLEGAGSPVRLEVSADDLVQEALSQGWVTP